MAAKVDEFDVKNVDEEIHLVQHQYDDRPLYSTSDKPQKHTKCTLQTITMIMQSILLLCILIGLVRATAVMQNLQDNIEKSVSVFDLDSPGSFSAAAPGSKSSSDSSDDSESSDNNGFPDYEVVITFTICNLPADQLTDASISGSELEYKQIFSSLFNVNQENLNPSIETGDFCSFRGLTRRLQNGADEFVIVTIPVDTANEAATIQAHACVEAGEMIDMDGCEAIANFAIPSINSNSTNQEQCMSDICHDKLDIEIANKSALRIHTLPSALLPGYQFLSYSFNLFTGMPPTDLILEGYYRQIIDFTFAKEQVSSGTNDYLVPDQFDLPSVSGLCTKQSSTSSVSSSMSTSSMSREAFESTGTESFEASIEAGGWGVSVSASTAMSSSYSNSRSSSASRSAARSGKTSSSYTYSKALLYSTQLQWDTIDSYQDDFKNALNTLNNSNTTNMTEINRLVILFIGDFGTHVLDLARMGARCRQTTYYSSSMSSEAYSYAADSSYSSSEEESYSASASGGGFGFSASASAAYAASSSQGQSSSVSGSFESTSTVEYSSETIDCIGEVAITSKCGDMLGTQNQPALVGYRLKAIWNLPIFNNYSTAKTNFLSGLEKIDDSAINCGKRHCGGLGICAIDKSFWTTLKYKDWNAESTFDSMWDRDLCLNQYEIGQSLMRSGRNIKTQMNQCNSSDEVQWGERNEVSQITYDPFCAENMQIGIGLNLVNNSVDFSAVISDNKTGSFKIAYSFNSTREYDCIEIGGVSYAMFCENTIVRVNRIRSSNDHERGDGNSMTYTFQPDPPLNCSIYPEQGIFAIGVVSGFHGALREPVGVNNIIENGEHADSVTVFYDWPTKFFDLGRFWGYVDMSIISFCNDPTAIRYGTEVMDFSDSNFIPQSLPSPYLYRKWIRFQPIALSCLSVNVFVAFSHFGGDNLCSMAVWSENESGAGFSMVFGIWNATVGEVEAPPKCGENNDVNPCLISGDGVSLDTKWGCPRKFEFIGTEVCVATKPEKKLDCLLKSDDIYGREVKVQWMAICQNL